MADALLSRADIPVAALDIVQERVEHVARRAHRKGFSAPRLLVGRRYVKQVRDTSMDEAYEGMVARPDPVFYDVEFVEVSIFAPGQLQINGWAFIASVDSISTDDSVEALYRRVPGTEEIPLPVWGKAPDDCDHCGVKRQRNETFILAGTAEDSGQYKQVGRQCVRDFIGYDPTALLAAIEAYMGLVFDEDEIGGWSSSAPRVFSLQDVLDAAARMVLIQGFYVSKQKAQESQDASMFDAQDSKGVLVATGSGVREYLTTPPKRGYDWRDRDPFQDHRNLPQEKVDALITASLDGIEEIRGKHETSEWEDNILLVSRSKHIEWKHVGIAASAIIVGWRRQERVAKAQVAGKTSVHIGEVDTRIEVEAVIERIIFIDNDYGGSFLVKMWADKGELQWWASSEPSKDIDTGSRVKVKGRVKRHDYDRLTKTPITLMTRCKLTLIPDAPVVVASEAGTPTSHADDLGF